MQKKYPYVRMRTKTAKYHIVVGRMKGQNKYILLEDKDGFDIVFTTKEKAERFLEKNKEKIHPYQ